jgi:hypothetical protein
MGMPNIDVHLANMIAGSRWKFEAHGTASLLSACSEIQPNRGRNFGSAADFARQSDLGVVTGIAVAMGEPST